MRWFGQSWGAPVCASYTFVPYEKVPAFCKLCIACEKPITESDHGLMMPHLPFNRSEWMVCGWHLQCLMENMGLGQRSAEEPS